MDNEAVFESELSISSGDVSTGDVGNITVIVETPSDTPPTLWEKSLSEYTVVEGLLLLVFLLLLAQFFMNRFKGAGKWHK